MIRPQYIQYMSLTATIISLVKCKILSVITSVGAVSNLSYPAIPRSYDIKSKTKHKLILT